MTTPLVVCHRNLLLAAAQQRPPWQTPCPPPIRALPRAPPNNMLIVTSFLSLPPSPSCPGNAAPANPRPPPPSCTNSAITAQITQLHTRRHRHPTPPPTSRQHLSTPAAPFLSQQCHCTTTALTTPWHVRHCRFHFPLPSFTAPRSSPAAQAI